jgi:hypothetical protein
VILIITTANHGYTHQSLHSEQDIDVQVVSYLEMLNKPRSRVRATYVFTDCDRLAPPALHQAALLYRELRDEGFTVLNDPARTLGRFGFLRALNRAGINQFDAYRADALEKPQRWPVFLRMEGSHLAPLSGLIDTQEELDSALESSLTQGVPRSALVIIEYAAEPVRPGLFRKLSVFRVGPRLLGYTCVHDDQWLVKYGKTGIGTPDLYEEEYECVANNPFGEMLLPAFEIAGVDYGRADFGLVGGRPQIYEINTNPDITLRPPPSPAQRRNDSVELFRKIYLDAMRAIDTSEAPVAKISKARSKP